MLDYHRLDSVTEAKLHQVLNLMIVVLSSFALYMMIIAAPIVKSNIRHTIESNLSPNIDKIIERNLPSIMQMAKKGRLPG